MSDFSDAPFVAGSLFGLRAFALDGLGRLHGPSFNQVFRPGENEAVCRKDETRMFSYGGLVSPMTFTVTAPDYDAALRRALGMPQGGKKKAKTKTGADVDINVDPPKHVVGQQDCSCGFYAYFDGGNDYKQPDRVSAIIEGYGRCTVGSRGFRAEKAKLTALVMKPSKRERFPLILRNYPDTPIYDRLSEALAAHPISTDQIPSPVDADFWTRPVR